MSTNLYDILGIQPDATEEQIRKAYKKRALKTHPDRVPPEQKAAAEEEFRKVNNAYEVLIDTNNRRAYDAAGVWPPPPPGSAGSHHRRRHRHPTREPQVPFPEDPFNDFDRHFNTGLTDPFRLFESIFGELRHAMADPFFPDPWRRGRRHDSYHQRGRGFFDDPSIGLGFPFERGFDDRVNAGGGRTRAYSQVSRSALTPDGRWVAESRVTRTVNGVTESIWKRKDGMGNEYATYTSPDGRKRHTINGREQISPQQHVPPPQRIQPSPPPHPPPPIQTSSLPPPPPYSNISRKRDSPTSVPSSRKRDSPSREHHSPVDIPPPSHAVPPPPPPNHHYRSPPSSVRDYPYAHETPHYKSRYWKR